MITEEFSLTEARRTQRTRRMALNSKLRVTYWLIVYSLFSIFFFFPLFYKEESLKEDAQLINKAQPSVSSVSSVFSVSP
jgi:predicted CDP-diglyceride synthetase/phosphatidate cytidylyltransferase